jgi:hypothetical protein
MKYLPCACVSLVCLVDDDVLCSLLANHYSRRGWFPQFSVEAYVRSAREGGAYGSGLAIFLAKYARSDKRLRTH